MNDYNYVYSLQQASNSILVTYKSSRSNPHIITSEITLLLILSKKNLNTMHTNKCAN